MIWQTGKTQEAIRARRKNIFNADVVEFVEANSPALPKFIDDYVAKFVKSDKPINFKVIGGLMWFFAEKHYKQADTFFDKLMNGVNVDRDEPVYILRRKLLQDKSSLVKMQDTQKAVFVIKTWNAMRKGEEMKILKWNPANENVPTII